MKTQSSIEVECCILEDFPCLSCGGDKARCQIHIGGFSARLCQVCSYLLEDCLEKVNPDIPVNPGSEKERIIKLATEAKESLREAIICANRTSYKLDDITNNLP